MRPERRHFEGSYVELEPLSAAAHADSLWDLTKGQVNDHLWRYLPWGPYSTRAEFDADMAKREASPDPMYWAILDRKTRRAVGYCALMRIDEPNRVIETGGILYSPALRKTRGATEAMYLLARYVFEDLGYRRYEWKCNALNAPSKAAAERLGFTYEGMFRQHMIVKGENRDTAWYSMLDSEWPVRKHAFERWLDASNFDADGRQLSPLSRS